MLLHGLPSKVDQDRESNQQFQALKNNALENEKLSGLAEICIPEARITVLNPKCLTNFMLSCWSDS